MNKRTASNNTGSSLYIYLLRNGGRLGEYLEQPTDLKIYYLITIPDDYLRKNPCMNGSALKKSSRVMLKRTDSFLLP